MEESSELKEALCEVRKAYRLVAVYQRRILDMAKTIQKKFDYKSYWYINVQYDIRGRSLPTDRRSMDLLPLYNGLSMLFLPQKAESNYPKRDEWMLEIRFDNDSGFEIRGSQEPNPKDFKDPRECESKIWLCAFGVMEDSKEIYWLDVFNNIEWPADDNYLTKNGKWAAGKYYNLSTIPDEKALITTIEDFNKFIDEKRKDLGFTEKIIG